MVGIRREQVALFGFSASGVITCSFIVHFHGAPSEMLVHYLFSNIILSIEKVQVISCLEKMFSFLIVRLTKVHPRGAQRFSKAQSWGRSELS